MNDTRTETFRATLGLKLSLTDLTATVQVAAAEPGSTTARVDIQGDSKYRSALTVAYDPRENRLTITEAPGFGSGGSVVISGGDVVIGNGTVQANAFGRGSHSSVVSFGHGSISTSGGRVIVNGRDITSIVNGTGSEPDPIVERRVTVTVPTGTDTGIDGCDDVAMTGTNGRIRASISGQGSLRANTTTGAKMRLSGQTSATLTRSTGPLDLSVKGQSTVAVEGRFGDVDLSVSGQSTVNGNGTFGHVSGDVSGMSNVRISGQATGNSVRTSGMSSANIPAPAGQRGTNAGDWDF